MYLDTNGVTDFSEPRAPVDAAMRSAFLAAVDDGRIVVPLSDSVAQEIAAVSVTNQKRADRLGRFYVKIASPEHALPSTGIALRQAIAECLGDPVVARYENLTAGRRKAVRRRLTGKVRADVARITAEYRRDSEDWATATLGFRDKARTLMLATDPDLKPMPLAKVVSDLWSEMAPYWGWGLVEGRGLLERAREAKLSDEALLRSDGVRMAVGSAVALAAAQTVNGRLPRPADFGDFQHCTLAACAGLPLVTHDEDLRKLIEAVPDSPLRVLSAAEMLEQADA